MATETSTPNPPLLILCAQIAALALTRRLGRAGVRVGLADTPEPMPVAFRSRYACQRFPLPPAANNEEAVLSAIEAAGALLTDSSGARPALLATSDETVLLISRHRQRLGIRFRLLLPEHDTLARLLDKRQLHPLAEAHGIAVPRSIPVTGRGDLRPAAAELGFPLLLKSAYGNAGAAGNLGQRPVMAWRNPERQREDAAERPTGATRAKSGEPLAGKVRVGSLDQLLTAYDRLAGADRRLLLQEYLPGGAERVALYNAYFNADSVPVAVFTGRKVRQYPIEFGTASMSEACAVAGLAEPLTAFLRALRFRGPVDIGLKWDERSLRYKLLDVNPRLGQNYRTFVAAGGEDLGWLAYRELAGERVTPAAPLHAVARRWKIEVQDARSCRDLHRLHRLSFTAWARDWLAWQRGEHERALWSWRDPRPGWHQWRRQRPADAIHTPLPLAEVGADAPRLVELAARAASER